MDELTHYIITYYPGLMTPQEFQGYRSVIGHQKIENRVNPDMKAMLQKVLVSEDPEVLSMLKDGDEAFLIRVRDRILREHPDVVFLNYCPRCGALANTPQAKQCPKCYLSWHEPAAPQDV